MIRKITTLALGITALSGTVFANAEDTAASEPSLSSPVKSASSSPRKKAAGLPFIFSSEDWGVALGGAGVINGIGQPQMSLFGTAIASSNGTMLGYLGLYNVMIPEWDQVQFDFSVLEANFKKANYYLSGNPDFAGQSAGSNESSVDNYVHSGAREQNYQIHMRYTLPIGAGKEGAMAATARKARGYKTGGIEWNPLTSGITTFELQPFYQTQRLDEFESGALERQEVDKGIGMRFILEYDNRNSSQLPTRGSRTAFTWTHDWGNEDRPDWSTVEFEFSKFISLGSNDFMNQQVIALNAWVADTPTWNDTTTVNGEEVYRRAPSFAGVTLGGWDKLRGYNSDRFHGRSAVSYSLEYRMMPKWNPLEDMPIIGPMYDIPWWQWTLFMDAGRVADNFDVHELHRDMKTSFGGGIRFRVEGVTVRTEVASGAEEWYFRVFVNQPF